MWSEEKREENEKEKKGMGRTNHDWPEDNNPIGRWKVLNQGKVLKFKHETYKILSK